jgi:hypothetical protein
MGDMGQVTEDDDDQSETPVEPAIRRSSGMGEVPCPKCGGALVPCSLCLGKRTVGLSVAVQWAVERSE